VLAVVGLFGLPLLRGTTAGRPITEVVAANEQWTDSGVDLRPGQRIRITASGEISSMQGVNNGPEGSSADPYGISMLPTERHAALIAKVGNDGRPFLVGRGTTHRADGQGRLYLGVNDLAVMDNSGYYQVDMVLLQ
jgi:hypothetical protein